MLILISFSALKWCCFLLVYIEFMAQLQGPGLWADVMKRKRAIHEKVINLVQQQRTNKLADEVNMLHAIALINTEFHKSQ